MKTTRPPCQGLIMNRWRPASFRDVMESHLPFFLMGALPLLAAHAIGLGHLPLVPCWFLEATGLPCPFCGYTRSFQAMVAGNFLFALANCPLSCVLYVACWAMGSWNGVAMVSGMRFEPGRMLRLVPSRTVCLVSAVLVLVNWGWRLAWGLI